MEPYEPEEQTLTCRLGARGAICIASLIGRSPTLRKETIPMIRQTNRKR